MFNGDRLTVNDLLAAFNCGRFGKVGKRVCKDTGPLTKERMVTIDDDIANRAVDPTAPASAAAAATPPDPDAAATAAASAAASAGVPTEADAKKEAPVRGEPGLGLLE